VTLKGDRCRTSVQIADHIEMEGLAPSELWPRAQREGASETCDFVGRDRCGSVWERDAVIVGVHR